MKIIDENRAAVSAADAPSKAWFPSTPVLRPQPDPTDGSSTWFSKEMLADSDQCIVEATLRNCPTSEACFSDDFKAALMLSF